MANIFKNKLTSLNILSGISLKIWLPFAVSISLFIIIAGFYYPKKQEQIFIENYNSKIRELAKTVALGVELTLSSDNFQGLKKTIDLAKSSSEFEFIAIVESSEDGIDLVFQVNPDSIDSEKVLNRDSSAFIYESCAIKSEQLSGYVLIAFSKDNIRKEIFKLNLPVYKTLIIILILSLIIFLFFANTISRPIRKLTRVANQLEKENYTVDIYAVDGNDEISNLNNALNSLKTALIKAKKRNDEFNKQLEDEIEINTRDLKATTKKLLNAQSLSGLSNYDYDLSTGKWNFSSIIHQIFSMSQGEWDENNWLDLIIPEDRSELLNSIENTIKTAKPLNKDFKFNFTDTSKPEKWISIIAEPQFDENGNLFQLSGSFQDITERKIIENEINKLSLVAKKTSNCVIITNTDRNIIWVNESTCKVTGYSFEELLGKSPKMFQSPKTNPETIAHIGKCLNENQEVKVEILNVNKFGKEYWLDLNIVPLFDQKDELMGFMAVETDITEQKKAEEELLNREKMLFAISKASNILLKSINTKESIASSLEIMGQAVDVHRTYIFSVSKDANSNILASQIFEWNSGFANSQIDNPEMQNLPINEFEEFVKFLYNKKPFFKLRRDFEENSKFRSILESQDILSLLIIPIFKEDEIWGYVGFDDCNKERIWTDAEITILSTFATAIENSLDREEKTETIKSMALFPELNPNPIIRIDLDGKIVLENEAAQQISYLELEDKTISKQDFLNFVVLKLNQIKNKLQIEVRIDQNIFYAVDCLYIEETNQINLYFNDISQLKENEIQLLEAKVRAEISDKAKEEFIANMSHEIRTPLHAISGLSKILKKSELSSENTKLVNHIAQSGDHLNSLINNVLDFTKITAGEFKLNFSSFSLQHVIKQLQSILYSIANEKGLALNFNIASNIHDMLIGDETRLRQALLNLLNNSLKFTEKGSVSLSANIIDENKNSQIIQIVIADTGIGMSEEFINKIFDKFSQEDSSLGRKYGGTGLGMAITKGLVEMMQGSIKVESQKNIGTTFTLEIPFEKNLQNFDNLETNEKVKNKLNNIKILVVEDNDINLLVAKTLLENHGIKVFDAKNGKEAIEHPNLNEVDLILMDLQMPEMNGFEATNYLRNVLKLELPIIALTANALKTEIERCFELGMNDYVLKPYNEMQLIDAITKNLNLYTELTTQIEEAEEIVSNDLYNLDMLKTLSAGSDEFMVKIISMFLEMIPQSVSDIQTAFEAEDYQTTKSIAHKIKATYIQFGIKPLEKDIFHLNYFDANNPSEIEKCKPAILNLVEKTDMVIKELETIIAEYN